MAAVTEEELIKAFHQMWDNYPESVRLIHRSFRVVAGNKKYIATGGTINTKCNVGDPSFHKGCQAMNCLKLRETRTVSVDMDGIAWESYWVPVEGSEDYYVHFTNGVNAYIQKKAQEAAASASQG